MSQKIERLVDAKSFVRAVSIGIAGVGAVAASGIFESRFRENIQLWFVGLPLTSWLFVGMTTLLAIAVGMSIFQAYLKTAEPSGAAGRHADEMERSFDGVSEALREKLYEIETSVERLAKNSGQAEGPILKEIAELRESTRKLLLDETSDRSSRDDSEDVARRAFRRIIDRLDAEHRAMNTRAITNLFFGLIFSLLAIGAIIYFFFVSQAGIEAQDPTFSYLKRVSASIFLQVLAYFFLRLYVQNLNDAKYYLNEIHNAEAKQLGVRLASRAKDKPLLKQTILKLLQTERNVIIDRNKRTIYDSEVRNDFLEVLRTLGQRTSRRPAETN